MHDERDVEQVVQALRAEHKALEQRLAELNGQRSLTPSEQIERAELKKLKLAKKDAIERIARSFRASA